MKRPDAIPRGASPPCRTATMRDLRRMSGLSRSTLERMLADGRLMRPEISFRRRDGSASLRLWALASVERWITETLPHL